MSRALTTALSITLVVVIGAAVLQRTSGDEPPPPEPSRGDAVPAQERPNAYTAPSLPTADAPRAWVEIEVVQTVRRVGERFEVTRNGQPLHCEVAVVAGAGGAFVAPEERRGPVLVRARFDGRELHRRVARRDDGGLSVEIGPDRPVRGRVVDDKAQPIAGAIVWVGGKPEDVVSTDADGRFETVTAAGVGVPVVVRAEGKAHKFAFVQVEPANGAELTFVLLESMPVLAQAAGTVDALRDAEIAVVPIGISSTELQTYPFFAQGLWSDTALDADGRATLRGLPRGCVVGLLLLGPGVCRAAPIEVSLLGDQPVRASLPAPPRPRAMVELVDERMAPLRGCEVRCEPQERVATDPAVGQFLLPEWLPPRGGSFFVRGDGQRSLAIAQPSKPIRLVASDGVVVTETEPFVASAAKTRLVLPQRPLGRPSIVVPPPQSGVAWFARVDPVTKGEFVEVAADEAFVANLEGPMVVDVRVRIPDGAAWSVPREQRGIVAFAPVGLPPALLGR